MQRNNWNFLVRTLHWLAVLVLMAGVAAVWGHEAFEKTNPLRGQLMQLHFMLGGTIGALTLLRLLIRAMTKAPAHSMPRIIARMAMLGHTSLYFLMILLPVCGYIAVSGRGLPVNLLGLMELPSLPVSKELAQNFKEIHEGLANGLIALIAVHVSAAIFHAVILKGKVMQSMLGRAD